MENSPFTLINFWEPLGYDPERFRPDGSGLRASGRFTFLSVFEWGERKAYVHRIDADHYTYANRAVTLIA